MRKVLTGVPQFNKSALKRAIYALFEVVESRSTSDELTIVCPQPGCGDSTGNRSVNLKTGATNCWRCGVGGFVLKWAAALGREIDLDDDALYEREDFQLDGIEFEQKTGTFVPYVNSELKMPRGFISLADEPDCGYAKLIARMAKRKNLELDDFIDAGAGFTREDYRWEKYCIFPVVEWGNTVYFQGRTYSDVPGESTKRFPSRQSVPLGSRYWVYNIDELRKRTARKAIVVEAILNVLSLKRILRDPTVVPIAVFKHKLSRVQAYKISQCKHVEEINLCFDSDATADAWESCSGLINRFDVTITEMPHGIDANDDANEALRRFDRRRKFSTVNKLLFDVQDL